MKWGRYEQLRPDQLQTIVQRAPVAYWPLGLLEHHGWHLPVGFDGLKAERFCQRLVRETGGVLLPVMWWGGRGGHGEFKWTLYQPEDAACAILANTLERLIGFGFRCFVLLAGHYPWRGIAAHILLRLKEQHPNVHFICGTEADIGAPKVRLGGDHAARWETAYGLALLPELVRLEALREGRDECESWPQSGPPPAGERHPGVEFDASRPLFAQMGDDARNADAEQGGRALARLAEHLVTQVHALLTEHPEEPQQ